MKDTAFYIIASFVGSSLGFAALMAVSFVIAFLVVGVETASALFNSQVFWGLVPGIICSTFGNFAGYAIMRHNRNTFIVNLLASLVVSSVIVFLALTADHDTTRQFAASLFGGGETTNFEIILACMVALVPGCFAFALTVMLVERWLLGSRFKGLS